MLTAHLPSGYCLAKLAKYQRLAFAAALVGSVFPDLDMLFFHLVDNKSIHHHRYWVHIPLFWGILAAFALPLLWRTNYRVPAIAFFAALGIHLVLDSVGGGIMWLAPFSDYLWSLIIVPATQSHWVLSYLFHWTFLLEIMIWLLAAYLMFWRPRQDSNL